MQVKHVTHASYENLISNDKKNCEDNIKFS